MAHPKRRISKHKKRVRRSHLGLEVPAPNHCPRCGSAKLPHRVCETCGHYGFGRGGEQGTRVLERDDA